MKQSDNPNFWAVCLLDTGKLIGNIYLEKQGFDTWKLGYVFNEEYQDKGYASEAAKALMKDIFIEQNGHRIIAMCNPLNTASWELMERLHMKREVHHIKNVYFFKDCKGNPIW